MSGARVRQRGFTMMEAVVCFAIVSVLIAAVFGGSMQRQRHMTEAWHETAARKVAEGRLEALAESRSVEAGITQFEIARELLPGGRGRQTVRARDEDLFEVVVEVRWRAPGTSRDRRIEITTLTLREGH